MLSVPLLNQQDPQWKDIKLGDSNVTIQYYGCVITCLTALAQKTNVGEVNELFKGKGVYVQGNLVDWTKVPLALPNLKFIFRSWVYDNNQVANWIYNKNYPVIVQVNAAPIGSPKGTHYVVYLGDHKILDPWTGQIESVDKYPNPQGYILYEVAPIVPQHPTILIPSDKILAITEGPGSDGDKLQLIRSLCQ